ncbi:ATP-dependent protease ClpP protease subunit [Bradyrhizobium sp. USDA 377]
MPSGVDIALGRASKRDTGHFLRQINGAGNRNIECRIDCAGGDADSALAIATALLRHPFRVTARIAGRCSSAAVYIALGADKRTIVPDGSVLIHKACRVATLAQWKNVRQLPPSERRKINESLNDTDDATVSLLTTRLGVSEDVARQWLAEDKKWTAEEALAKGFVHSIIADLEAA